MRIFSTKKLKLAVTVMSIVALTLVVGIICQVSFNLLLMARGSRVIDELCDTQKAFYTDNVDDFELALIPDINSDGHEIINLTMNKPSSETVCAMDFDSEGGIISSTAFGRDQNTGIYYRANFVMLFKGIVFMSIQPEFYKTSTDGEISITEAIEKGFIDFDDIIEEFNGKTYWFSRG